MTFVFCTNAWHMSSFLGNNWKQGWGVLSDWAQDKLKMPTSVVLPVFCLFCVFVKYARHIILLLFVPYKTIQDLRT